MSFFHNEGPPGCPTGAAPFLSECITSKFRPLKRHARTCSARPLPIWVRRSKAAYCIPAAVSMNTLNTRPPNTHAKIRSVSCSFIGCFHSELIDKSCNSAEVVDWCRHELWVPGTIVLLAGGVVVSRSRTIALSKQKRKRRAEKFEELVVALYEHKHWLDTFRSVKLFE